MVRSYEYSSGSLSDVCDLSIHEEFPGCVTVKFKPTEKLLSESQLQNKDSYSNKTIDLITINERENFLTLFPINTLPTHSKFLEKKYDNIESITLEGFYFEVPESVEELLDVLEQLPSGFIKDCDFGLGFQKDYRFIIEAIENNESIKHLVISSNKPTAIDNDLFTLKHSQYDSIRRGINRISSSYQSEARIEKSMFSFNSILHKLDPERYEEKKKQYKKGEIYKIIEDKSNVASHISETDADAVLNLLSENKKKIYERNKDKIKKFNEELDLLSLEELISKSEKLIDKKSSEDDWQKLFSDNPHILSMLFGYPIMKIREQASIGGRNIEGKGDKITDFLVKNNLTGNVGIVEIKKPKTSILNNRSYRGGVYSVSSELSGSVAQLLDQKYKFQKEISMIKDNSGIYDMESYAIDCILIIGVMPEEKEQKKSFELYRHNLRDIKVITFDEVIGKLKILFQALSSQ